MRNLISLEMFIGNKKLFFLFCCWKRIRNVSTKIIKNSEINDKKLCSEKKNKKVFLQNLPRKTGH